MNVTTVIKGLIENISTNAELDIYYDAEDHDDAPAAKNINDMQMNIKNLENLNQDLGIFIESSLAMAEDIKNNPALQTPATTAWLNALSQLSDKALKTNVL